LELDLPGLQSPIAGKATLAALESDL